MKELLIQIEGSQCTAIYCSGTKRALARNQWIMCHGIHSWTDLLGEVHERLKLDRFNPPGMPTEGDWTCRDVLTVWQVVLCGTPTVPGWGWGFVVPTDANEHVIRLDTCCGFRDQAAAAKAAKTMQHNQTRITGDLPGGVFEIFTLDAQHAFLDPTGEIHATFPTHAEARGCAAKIEAEQSMNPTPNNTPS